MVRMLANLLEDRQTDRQTDKHEGIALPYSLVWPDPIPHLQSGTWPYSSFFPALWIVGSITAHYSVTCYQKYEVSGRIQVRLESILEA